jgi:hypothetical protein
MVAPGGSHGLDNEGVTHNARDDIDNTCVGQHLLLQDRFWARRKGRHGVE